MKARVYGGASQAERQSVRRNQLLEAAYNLLAGEGPAGVTVTAVSKEAGLSPRYFYEHFDNRDVLVQELIDRDAETVMAFIRDQALSTAGDPETRIRAGVEALLDALEADPRRAALGVATLHRDSVMRFRATVTRRMSDELARELNALLPDRETDVLVVSRLVIVGINELVIDWLGGQVPLERVDLVDVATRFASVTASELLGIEIIRI
ncbi:MAG TPA: TetR/AcrR family transcriptional regulator [Nocardioidaceae bacterium]|nr:TetR/AcrR family transcriptional regulator [Nocardioidaceae bacterium]